MLPQVTDGEDDMRQPENQSDQRLPSDTPAVKDVRHGPETSRSPLAEK